MQPVWVALSLVAVVSGINLLLCLALVARVRTLQDNMPGDPALPRVGERVNPFETASSTGQPISHADLAHGSALVGYFAAGCAMCRRIREELVAAPPAMPVYAFVVCDEVTPAEVEIAEQMSPIAKVVFTKLTDAPGRAFREAGFPTLIRVQDGVVAASGHRLVEVLR